MQSVATKLHLSPHVFACFTGGQLVLLDVHRDEHMGLSAAQARALSTHVAEWPTLPEALESEAPLPAESVSRLIERLCTKGIFCAGSNDERQPSPALPVVQSKLVRERPGVRPQVRLSDAGPLLLASLRAGWYLRLRSLESTLRDVRDRKRGRLAARTTTGTAAPHSDDVRRWVMAFIYLRPLLFGARDHCLFDSLALIEYLAQRGVFPTWVFGVRASRSVLVIAGA